MASSATSPPRRNPPSPTERTPKALQRWCRLDRPRRRCFLRTLSSFCILQPLPSWKLSAGKSRARPRFVGRETDGAVDDRRSSRRAALYRLRYLRSLYLRMHRDLLRHHRKPPRRVDGRQDCLEGVERRAGQGRSRMARSTATTRNWTATTTTQCACGCPSRLHRSERPKG